jgi:hypothetical protein
MAFLEDGGGRKENSFPSFPDKDLVFTAASAVKAKPPNEQGGGAALP